MRSLARPRRRTLGGLSAVELAASEGSPTVLCLHGYGANAMDLAPLAAELDLARPARWIFPDGPLPIPAFPRGRAWFPIDDTRLAELEAAGGRLDLSEARPSGLDEAAASARELILELGRPWGSLVLGGFSQGAMLAVELALTAPERPLGLFILSGALVDRPGLERLAPSRAGLKFFQSHGTSDPILGYEEAGRLNAALNAAGLSGELLGFDGGHGVPRAAALGLERYLNSILD